MYKSSYFFSFPPLARKAIGNFMVCVVDLFTEIRHRIVNDRIIPRIR